jgi:hypothetical protein
MIAFGNGAGDYVSVGPFSATGIMSHDTISFGSTTKGKQGSEPKPPNVAQSPSVAHSARATAPIFL